MTAGRLPRPWCGRGRRCRIAVLTGRAFAQPRPIAVHWHVFLARGRTHLTNETPRQDHHRDHHLPIGERALRLS